ncbi:hypothetical protein B7463_g1250, partial [Scytalidium lignicola]
MPTRQKTFGLVPTTLAKPPGAKPPMTSKQAKKAYLAARRKPKVSREEQRRLDKEELERQKKEYEREKAAAKAKLAREKKAAKAAAERADRKQKGQPEPNKSVRASQPRISLFVQKLDHGNKRTWEEVDNLQERSRESSVEWPLIEGSLGMEKKEVEVAENADGGKKMSQEFESAVECDMANDRELLPKPDRSIEEPLYEPPEDQSNETYEMEEARNYPKISLGDSPVQLDQPIEQSAPTPVVEEDKGASKTQDLTQIPIEEVQEPMAEGVSDDVTMEIKEASKGTPQQDDSDDEFGPFPAMSQLDIPVLQTSLLEDSNENSQGYIELRDGPTQRRRRKPIQRDYDYEDDEDYSYDHCEIMFSRHPFIQAHIEARDGYVPSWHRETGRKRYDCGQTASYNKNRNSVIPQSSRRRVLGEISNNTSSALSLQKRAIYGASKHTKQPPPSRSVNGTAHNEPSRIPPSATQSFLEQHLDDFFPSPSQEVRELLMDIDDLPSNTQIEKELQEPPPPKGVELPDLPLILSQDIMSSQEELEIATSSPPAPPPSPPAPPLVPFFSTQDIMSSQEELEITTPHQPQPEMQGKDFTPPLSRSREPKPRSPFFQEKEEDLVHAALEESKIMANERTETIPFTAREQEQRRRKKRRRASSITTDYGDEELRDCEEELFALLG